MTDDTQNSSQFKKSSQFAILSDMGLALRKSEARTSVTINYSIGRPETYYFGARYYDPGLGRFVSADGLFINRPELCIPRFNECNLYGYAGNNPVKYIDSTGNWIHIAIGAGIGSVLNAGAELLTSDKSGWELAKDVGIAFTAGAVEGAVTAAIPGSAAGRIAAKAGKYGQASLSFTASTTIGTVENQSKKPNQSLLESTYDSLKSNLIGAGTGVALNKGANVTKFSSPLINDGEDHESQPIQAATDAAADGIRIYPIGIGSGSGAPVPDGQGGFVKDSSGRMVMTRLDEQTLMKMASITQGHYVRSTTGDLDLDEIYRTHIRKDLSLGQVSQTREKVWFERFWIFAVAAMFLLMFDYHLQNGRLRHVKF